MPCSPSSPTVISTTAVTPATATTWLATLKLSVSDLPMLSCHYIQKGLLFTKPDLPITSLLPLLQHSLSLTLSHFPPLAGRLVTDPQGFVHIACNDEGAHFVHANADYLSIRDILSPTHVPEDVKGFFALDGTVSYEGHFRPLLVVQVTELADGVFIGCTVNHAIVDGTSLWNFFNSFAELCRGARKLSKQPDFTRNFVKDSPAVLSFADGPPKVTFDVEAPLKERIFRFSRESILKLKGKVNSAAKKHCDDGFFDAVEVTGKENNDDWLKEKNATGNRRITSWLKTITNTPETEAQQTLEISSFQSLSAQLWRSVTRARKLAPSKPTTFRMAVNCRHRLEPSIHPLYFGNAIQSIPTVTTAGEVLSRDLRWCAELLCRNVLAHDDTKVRRGVEEFEKNPRVFPLGNFDGATITMGSSPRFPMYDNDFGWGRPLAIRSGRANKFDGKISAFPGREGAGSVDLEVLLTPETMTALENDAEFMQYVSVV